MSETCFYSVQVSAYKYIYNVQTAINYKHSFPSTGCKILYNCIYAMM